jgi:hypothetical protein
MPRFHVVEEVSRFQSGTRTWEIVADDAETAEDIFVNGGGTLISSQFNPPDDTTVESESIISITCMDPNPTPRSTATSTPDSKTMFVRVVKGGKSTEVMVPTGEVARNVAKAAGIDYGRVRRLIVTGVHICGDTRLRPNDVMYVE